MEIWVNTLVAVVSAVIGAFLAGLVGFYSARYIRTDEIKSHKNVLYIEMADIAKNSKIVMDTLYDAYCLIYCATKYGCSDYKKCIQLPSPVHGFYLRDMSIVCFSQLTFEQRNGLKALSFNLEEQEHMINAMRLCRPFSSINLGDIQSAIKTLGVIYHNATLFAEHKERYKMDDYSPEQMTQRTEQSNNIDYSDSLTIAKGKDVYEREIKLLSGL